MIANSDSPRIYAFDQLRATMMMLGLVIHAAIPYVVTEINKIKDPFSTNLFFDILVGSIHAFRMPLFFVVSGFFAAMLFFKYGAQGMFRNRVKRILYPLIIGYILLYPANLAGTHNFKANIGIETTTVADHIQERLEAGILNLETSHLWFLYYLFLYCIIACCIARVFTTLLPSVNTSVKKYFASVTLLRWAPLVFAIGTFISLSAVRGVYINTPTTFRIQPDIFSIYALFFAFGWFLFARQDVLPRFLQHHKVFLWLAFTAYLIVVAVVAVIYPQIQQTSFVYIFSALNAISSWCYVFGFLGLFLKHFNRDSTVGRYVSDASYWVYLVHLPLTTYFHSILVPFHISPFIKFSVTLSCVAILCMVSYTCFVRSTWIGKFLSGKKYNSNLSETNVQQTS